MRALVLRVELCSHEVKISLRDKVESTNADAQEKPGAAGQILVLRFVKQRRGVQNQIHLPAGQLEATRVINPSMARAMNRAWKWRHWFDKGEVTSLAHVAERDGCTEAYVRKLLPMAFLAPDIVAATLNGSLPRNLTIADLASHAMPLDWSAQRVRLGMAQ